MLRCLGYVAEDGELCASRDERLSGGPPITSAWEHLDTGREVMVYGGPKDDGRQATEAYFGRVSQVF